MVCNLVTVIKDHAKNFPNAPRTVRTITVKDVRDLHLIILSLSHIQILCPGTRMTRGTVVVFTNVNKI